MKRLREYLNEDFDPAIFNHDGGISIDDPTVVDALNSNLEMATAGSFRTPYNALEEVRKVLAYYKIFLPKSVFLDQTDGNDVFQISQFGEKTGMNDKGEVVTADDSSLFVYFEWSINEKGMYDVFACVCNQEELDDVLDDFESEVEEELQEEMSPAEVSKLMYKVKNAMMSDEHKALVKSYMAKAISEQQMPDLKKKMGAKKVTLPNMMRKEETINELYGKGSLEKIRDYHKNKEAELGKRKSGLDNTVNDRRSKTKGSVTIFHNNGKKTHIKGHGEEELTSVERNRDSLQAKRDLAKQSIRRATGLIKKRKSLAKEETINEISHKLAKKAEHKSAKDYYDKYDAETKARGKYIKSKTPEDKAEADAAKEKRTKAAKRTIRFQQYADKKKLKEETSDVLDKGLKRTDLGLSDKLNKKGKLSKHTQKWMKTLASGSGSLYSRSLGKPKGHLPEEKKSDAPFDNPTEKSSTPYKNPKAKAKQLARAAMKKALADKKK